LARRSSAVMATVTSALLSLMMPPFAYLLSGSVIGLITLRKGAAQGFQTITLALAILMLFSVVANVPYQIGLGYALAIWFPVWLVAISLRWTESHGIALLVAGLIASLVIIGIYIMLDDVGSWWKNWLTLMIEKNIPEGDIADYQVALDAAVALFNAVMAVGLMLNILSSVLLARWWQANLFNRGAFRKEFYALRLPVQLLPISMILIVLTLTLGVNAQSVMLDLSIIVMVMYSIQGISAIHRVVDRYQLSAAWLFATYCLIVLLPHLTVVLACLGITDVYLDWRIKKNILGK